MSKAAEQRALDILIARCGKWSSVHLRNGRVCMTYDVAWGHDPGAASAHITTNVSPGPLTEDQIEFAREIDFFHLNEITKIEDFETGAVLFEDTDESGS